MTVYTMKTVSRKYERSSDVRPAQVLDSLVAMECVDERKIIFMCCARQTVGITTQGFLLLSTYCCWLNTWLQKYD